MSNAAANAAHLFTRRSAVVRTASWVGTEPWRLAVRLIRRVSSSPSPAGRNLRRLSVGGPFADTAGEHPDPGAVSRLDQLYYHRRLALVRLALLLVDDLPTAEDVVQDAFVATLRRHGPYLAGVEDPEAYLRTSVVNAARSVLRRRKTVRAQAPEPEQRIPPPDDEVLLAEEHREVLVALHLLTRRQREVLVLRYWSLLTEAQIAATLGLSRGTVKSTASRALDALSRHLEGPR